MSDTQQVIFDVGAHSGEDTAYYLKRGFRVVAVEANPSLADTLATRFRDEIADRSLVLIRAAIAEQEGSVDFFINRRVSVWGTTNANWAARNEKLGSPSDVVSVPAIRFEQLLSDYGVPYYLKIDIEGADMLCVEALSSFREKPSYLSIESDKVKWKALLGEFKLLTSLGYDSFQIVDQSKIHLQKHDRLVEGSGPDHSFPYGSSGCFGRDLGESWMSATSAIAKYVPIFLRYTTFGDNTAGQRALRKWEVSKKITRHLVPGWYDTHARHSSVRQVAHFRPSDTAGATRVSNQI